MTIGAENVIVCDIVKEIIHAETGRSKTDLGMPLMVQAMLDEITMGVGESGGFAYLVWRAGQAGVDFKTVTGILEKYQAIFCMLPKALYAAINRGMDAATKINMN